jgi:hypothetical protein
MKKSLVVGLCVVVLLCGCKSSPRYTTGTTTVDYSLINPAIPLENHSKLLLVPRLGSEEIDFEYYDDKSLPDYFLNRVMLIPGGRHKLIFSYLRNQAGSFLESKGLEVTHNFRAGFYYTVDYFISGKKVNIRIVDITNATGVLPGLENMTIQDLMAACNENIESYKAQEKK